MGIKIEKHISNHMMLSHLELGIINLYILHKYIKYLLQTNVMVR